MAFNWKSLFTRGDPFDQINWAKRDAKISSSDGRVIFEQKNVEVPEFWSQTAIDIVASKYFSGKKNSPERESSAKQLMNRVAKTVSGWGFKDGYFDTPESTQNFENDLKWLLINQYASFNSPVWFNVGVIENPQSSACFILSVEDDMESILHEWYAVEGKIFKLGSGTGINISNLRSSKESLSKGGVASGPVSFMQGADGVANSIKSGGRTRRAAKMVVLNADHPDIKDFIYCKRIMEEMSQVLAQTGKYDTSIEGKLFSIYTTLPFQNANNSVRVTDEFMEKVLNDEMWDLKAVKGGETLEKVKAREILDWCADAAWHSADPGMQYDTTFNKWHTCPNSGRINATNPCSEYAHLDNSACLGPEVRISTKQGLIPVSELYKRQQNGETIYIKTELLSENAAVPRHGKRGYRPADVYARQITFRPAVVVKTGRKQLYKIKLSTDQTIRLTADHKVLTEEGWKEVKDLIIGKDAIVTQKQSAPIDYSEASQEEIDRYQMLGWMIGDGYVSRNGKRPTFGLVFGPEDYKTAQYLKPVFNGLVSQYTQAPWKNVGLSVQSNGVMQMGSTAEYAFQYLVNQYGVHPGVAPEKKVPASIFEAPKILQAAFLGALFSADGTIYARGIDNWSDKSGTPNLLVRLTSTSPKLLNDVQLLLFDFGIRSSITWTHPEGRKNPQGTLSIFGHAAYKFSQLIGFPLSEKKQVKASKILSGPFQGNSYSGRRAVVEEITEDEVDDVYDISEPITHSMIAEGMIIHNCNLASINLLRFLKDDNTFDIPLFKKATDTMILAQDILVDNSSYPTEKINQNAKNFRQLGLGFANLGSLLMAQGLPYDSDEGRIMAGAVSSIMAGEAYRMSAEIAKHKGPFTGYHVNKEPMLKVIKMHRDEAYKIPENMISQKELVEEARNVWDKALLLGQEVGYKNSQVTVIAPTGTIAFMMDCDTTGIEPELALIKYKKLVGGGVLRLVNSQVPRALKKLSYDDEQIKEITDYIDKNDTIEGAPHIKDEHLAVFDCSFKAFKGTRTIHYLGHLKMMGAVQPFISGAISKTVNLPREATKEEIFNAFIEAWKLGIKAVAFYRDGSKTVQPLNTLKEEKKVRMPKLIRRYLPNERPAIHHKFSIAGHEGYINVGLYPEDYKVGETFINMAKEGSTMAGLMDTIAVLTSVSLQYGIPLKVLVKKLKDMRFEPMGMTNNKDIPFASSIVDYVFKYLGAKFLTDEEKVEVFGTAALGNGHQEKVNGIVNGIMNGVNGANGINGVEQKIMKQKEENKNDVEILIAEPEIQPTLALAETQTRETENPLCSRCGFIMYRAGTCMLCYNCGEITGVCS